MADTIGRRELLVALGGGVAAWPLAARAQQMERIRRIGVLTNFPADDPEGQVRMAAFRHGLPNWAPRWPDVNLAAEFCQRRKSSECGSF